MLKCLTLGYPGLVRTCVFTGTLKTIVWYGSHANLNWVRPKVFRRYEDGYIVREMTPADVRIVQNWYCAMGKISPYDLNVVMSVSPPGPGFYIGDKDGVAIASLISIPWAEGVEYTSSFYVAEQYRHVGYGKRLVEEMKKNLGENISILDAMDKKAYDIFGKNGPEYAFKIGRFEGMALKSTIRIYKDYNILKVSDIPFDKIVDYDNKCFVRPNSSIRRAFLEQWLTIDDGASFAALNKSGHVVGYGQRRPCFQEKNHMIGPLYGDNPTIAKALLQSLCSEVPGENVTIDIWLPNEAALKMVQEFKMTEVFTADRMHLNGTPDEYKKTTFGITSLDVCGI